jgi:hypothetical protein
MERACRYRITSIETIERIAALLLREGTELPSVEIDDTFLEREAYQAGAVTDQPDLSIYENSEDLLQDDNE